LDALDRDPIATIRTVVRQVSSSVRRHFFSAVLRALEKKDLQLLRDVVTRWSSTLLMVERAILLRQAIDQFLSRNEFEELHKYRLSDSEWDALDVFKKILEVPHAFQQRLSAEKTPTLSYALPAFEAMASRWERMQEDRPEVSNIIQQGLDKLGSYQDRLERVPACTLAMTVDPQIKLRWFAKFRPEKIDWAKDLFKRELHKYKAEGNTSPVRREPTNWVDEVLGFDLHAPFSRAADSVDEEADVYLADSQVGTG
ncbi:HAT family dimerization domain-containing protein, partial [Favolaschia claudopus]